MTNKKILVTGTAGFIGYHTALHLLNRGDEVIGYDIINDYYDVNLKYARLNNSGINKDNICYGKEIQSNKYNRYSFVKGELEDYSLLIELFVKHKFDGVIHLAAQAGVRYSLVNPHAYIKSNIEGFMNILEACRHHKVNHLTYASSSSVYGLNTTYPLSVHDNVDHPISLYAASKKSNELVAHSYSHLYNIPTTGLRFFTVYGPWGRPDMAIFIFTNKIMNNEAIDVYNFGNMIRDFTYIDDIVEGIVRVFDNPPSGNNEWNGDKPDPATSKAPYRVFNIGNGSPVKLNDYIEAIEEAIGKKATKNYLPMQAGDVAATHADVQALLDAVNYKPATHVKEGIKEFVNWYKKFYN